MKWAITIGTCPYCDGPVTASTFSCDHAVPTSRNGSFDHENIVICCGPCNRAKGALTETEYDQLMRLLGQFEPVARVNILARLRAGGRIARG